MKTITFLILLLFSVRLPSQSFSGEYNAGLINKRAILSPVFMITNYQQYLDGLLMGLVSDSLVYLSDNRVSIIALKDIRVIKIGLLPEEEFGNILTGALAGAYLGQILLFSDESSSGFYLRKGDIAPTAYFADLLTGAAGGLLVYLLEGSGRSKDRVFGLQADNRASRAENMEKFKRFLLSDNDGQEQPAPHKLHLALQASQVISRYSKLPVQEDDRSGWYIYHEKRSSFNMLRKLQLTYSISENIALGAAMMFIGEPGINQSGYYYEREDQENPDDSSFSIYKSREIDESYSGTGYYAVIQLSPRVSIFPGILQMDAGLAIGGARIRYENKSQIFESLNYSYPPYHIENSKSLFSKKIDKWVFSAGLSVNAGIRLSGEYTLLLTGDYVFVPKESEEIPMLNLKKGSLGNFSYGITLCYSFF